MEPSLIKKRHTPDGIAFKELRSRQAVFNGNQGKKNSRITPKSGEPVGFPLDCVVIILGGKMILEKGESYLFEQDSFRRYPNISRVKCLEVTKECYLLKWDSGSEQWVFKNRIVDEGCFLPKYRVIEKL